ncbi:aminopeptidase N [Motilimonas pumila]|uniref:Aminopeptidase N n=1 Tax=Motilimonas pumila TaxID=2303987 RepID=A0A418YD49_9GAMM|nr:aminopeptidase N [Motilimonas pumila]RJG42436.1 aminopeptidase N [Motilimonas pumila]
MAASQPQAKHLKDYQAPSFLIDSIDLDFQLNETATQVTAVSKVRKAGQQNDLFLHGEHLTLISLEIDGQGHSDYTLSDEGIKIHQVPDDFILTLVTEINPQANTALEGLYLSGDAFCTQCEAEGFRRITYYLDRPDVLATYTTKITADKTKYPYLLSNGNKVASGDAGNGKHWVQWQDPFPKPCYLFALVAGEFDLLQDSYKTVSGRDVALEIFVDKGNLDKAKFAMQSLQASMQWDEQRFGLEYDLDIYMIVAVDFFNMGAMENKGLNVFNSKYVLANDHTATDDDYYGIEAVIGHEYFHNWTGNRITCRDWFQLSLKEGLTVFRDQEFSSDLGSRAVNRINNVRIIRQHQFAEDAGPMSHPIRPESVIEMNNFYTVTVYNKGSEVIRMIHTLLGEAGFRAGMDLYFERFDGQAVTCDDFVQAMEDASGVDLTQFRRWYRQSGTPQVTITDQYDATTQQYQLHVTQQTAPTAEQHEKSAQHIPMDIELLSESGEHFLLAGKKNQVLNVTQTEQTFSFDGICSKPIPALFREFSAPVKYSYQYSDQELATLMQFADNDFSRWDAAQNLFNKHLIANVTRVQQQQSVTIPEFVIDAYRGVLLSNEIDLALIAEVFAFASQSSLWELFEQVDIDAIWQARQEMLTQLSTALADELACVYRQHALKAAYQLNQEQAAKRALARACLTLLALSAPKFADELAQQHYQNSDNMTDTLSALIAANVAQLPCRDSLMQDFDQRWRHDALVLDKWFSLAATTPANDSLGQVKALLEHPGFSLKNPNRTRALIGSFVNGNVQGFHNSDGSGYLFLTDILCQLNTSNPQVAARLITPLIQFKRLDNDRQLLIKEQLNRLLSLPNLAKDLYEKVTRALAQ